MENVISTINNDAVWALVVFAIIAAVVGLTSMKGFVVATCLSLATFFVVNDTTILHMEPSAAVEGYLKRNYREYEMLDGNKAEYGDGFDTCKLTYEPSKDNRSVLLRYQEDCNAVQGGGEWLPPVFREINKVVESMSP